MFLTIYLIVGTIVLIGILLNQIFCQNGDSCPYSIAIIIFLFPIWIALWPIALLVTLADEGIIKDVDLW